MPVKFENIEAILFDLDGTLIDSAPDLGAAADKMRIDRGMPSMPLAHYRPMAGAGARGMISIAFGLGPDDSGYGELREEFFANYESRMTESTHAFDGVDGLLGALASLGFLWGVVTNKAERFALPLTRSMRLFDSAGTIVAGDTTPHAKPHPAPLLEAARQLGVEPQRCVYVGDDERDIVAGRAAGMLTVAAAYGYLGVRSEVLAWNADATIHKPKDLLNFLSMA
ncbi:MAG: HAD-IA family hydrolase [Polaromonas sp.]|nr:HAD-IA family hydrolase [Polaromonas sp.]